MKDKIRQLIKNSEKVIKDCALENGAIVAANIDKDYIHREVANYRWVWPRDAAFVCVAADLLGLKIQEPFFSWLERAPQDFERKKLLYANYATNGRTGSMGHSFQPDQAGEILWAIHWHFKNDLEKALKYQKLIERLAEGLCQRWEKTHFNLHTIDVWEEAHRHTSITMKNNFTFSLAACARGLFLAHEIISISIWKETALEMIEQIRKAYNSEKGFFYRTAGKINDANIDASLIGLAWPFFIYEPTSKEIRGTIKTIEKKIVFNGGVHRYQFDYYDGEGSSQEGGGAWPILNFWLSIYYSLAGQKEKAKQYYLWVLQRLEKDNYGNYIPEQIFDDFRRGICPLAWSHAMFIIASHYLGYL